VDKSRQPFDEGTLLIGIGQIEAERRGREFYFARRLGAERLAESKKEQGDIEANKQIHRFSKIFKRPKRKNGIGILNETSFLPHQTCVLSSFNPNFMQTALRSLLVAAIIFSAQMLFGQTPDSLVGTFENPIVVAHGDSVKNHVGKVISISGPIVGTKIWQGQDGATAFLDMFKGFPDNPFSITIRRDQLAFFDPVEQFKGEKVRVTGKVSQFSDKKTGRERYSIVLKKPEQIEVLKK
jgi:hypothetical protein